MTEVLQLCIYGLVLGSVIVLGAIGLSLTYGILNFANFAHGDMMTLGAYLALFFRFGLGLPLSAAVIAAMISAAILSVLIDRAVYRPLRSRGSITLLIASVVFRFRLEALVLGSAVMGIAGSLYGHFVGYISPTAFQPMLTTFIVWVMLIAGSGNNKGAIAGGYIVWAIAALFRQK